MSFILDALRKSESERQLESAPNMMRVPLSVPTAQLPTWAMIVMVMLTVALLGVAGIWWNSAQRVAPTLPDAAPAAGARDVSPREAPVPAPAADAAPQTAPESPIEPPAEAETAPRAVPTSAPSVPAEEPAAAARPPAELADAGAASSFVELPSVAQVVAEGVPVPKLDLQLLVNSDERANRFVLINGSRYTEGDRLVEGPELIAIIAEGAVLEQRGRRFLLTPN